MNMADNVASSGGIGVVVLPKLFGNVQHGWRGIAVASSLCGYLSMVYRDCPETFSGFADMASAA